LPSWDYTAISLPNSPQQICWASSSSNLPAEAEFPNIHESPLGRQKKSLVVGASNLRTWYILKKTISSLRRLFICIDALDECAQEHRRELIESLREILRVLPGARVFVTGRLHIGDEIVTCFSEVLRIPLNPTHGDIISYLEMRVGRDTDPKAMDDELRADIMRIIPEKVSEM